MFCSSFVAGKTRIDARAVLLNIVANRYWPRKELVTAWLRENWDAIREKRWNTEEWRAIFPEGWLPE